MDPIRARVAPPITRPVALERGYSDGEIRRLHRSGTWTSIRRGSYLPTADAQLLTAEQRHEALVRGTLSGLRGPAVVSHCSAAVILGIPLWSTSLATVHFTRPPTARNGRSASMLIHACVIDPAETVVINGIVVTDAARTIADLARTLPFEQAVVAADGALQQGLTTREQLLAAAERTRGIRGSRAAMQVIAFADGRNESVGESRSRVMMHRAGIPAPQLQFEVRDDDGFLIGRSDYAWRKGRLLGEFDGLTKYGRLLKPGETTGDVILKEKFREDAMRDAGARMVRWVWADLARPADVISRIQRGLAAVTL